MTTAVIFAVLSAVLFLLFLYYLSLLLFYNKEQKYFAAHHDKKEYFDYLDLRGKKLFSKRRKNFLLYLRCSAYVLQGNTARADALFPFVKKDPLLNVSIK